MNMQKEWRRVEIAKKICICQKKAVPLQPENKKRIVMEEIKFDKRNYRKHSKKNKDLIRKSLEELGAGRSVVIDNENELVAGNGVYEQAQALKMPVRIVETNGWQTGANERELEWTRLSVYNVNCGREIKNVLATRAKKHNAALFYKGMDDLKKYKFLLSVFEEVTVKTLNDSKGLTDDEVRAIVELGFKCKQNPAANDFAECRFAKPCFDPEGKEHKCCLCKAQGGFFGVSKCIVPCVMYNSNKQGELIWNRYGFAI